MTWPNPCAACSYSPTDSTTAAELRAFARELLALADHHDPQPAQAAAYPEYTPPPKDEMRRPLTPDECRPLFPCDIHIAEKLLGRPLYPNVVGVGDGYPGPPEPPYIAEDS